MGGILFNGNFKMVPKSFWFQRGWSKSLFHFAHIVRENQGETLWAFPATVRILIICRWWRRIFPYHMILILFHCFFFRNESKDEDTWPICLLEMVDGEIVTECINGCSNKLHHHCIAICKLRCKRMVQGTPNSKKKVYTLFTSEYSKCRWSRTPNSIERQQVKVPHQLSLAFEKIPGGPNVPRKTLLGSYVRKFTKSVFAIGVKSKIMRQMCYKMAQKSYIFDTFQHHFFW